MPTTILDGKIAREYYVNLLRDRVVELSKLLKPVVPQLAIIQVGHRTDSDSFIKSKKIFAQKIGVKEIHVQLDENVSQAELSSLIEKYNSENDVHGIIVQLPLPAHLNSNIILEKINPKKDVDGLTSQTTFTPATARGISHLLDFYKISLENKKVAVIGRSKLVGTPVANMCRDRGAEVTVCHKATKNIPTITQNSDIVIVAIGQPKFIGRKFFSESRKDQIVIDVGITREGDTLVGDVDFEGVKDVVAMITPVPGGVGQLTVLALFENLISACYNTRL